MQTSKVNSDKEDSKYSPAEDWSIYTNTENGCPTAIHNSYMFAKTTVMLEIDTSQLVTGTCNTKHPSSYAAYSCCVVKFRGSV
jgi:hypothetical protein